MDEKVTLFHMMFGAQAEMARLNASERLLRWAELFAGWLAERGEGSEARGRRAMLAWKKYLAFLRKPPWEGQQADLYGLIEQLEQEGKCEYTIRILLIEVDSFYRYAIEHLPSEERLVNPAATLIKPACKRNGRLTYLTQEQCVRLLEAARSQEGILGMRDYAMILMVLSGPLRYDEIRVLQWRALDLSDLEQATAERREGRRPSPAKLDAEQAKAIDELLRQSGRLGSMRGDDYVFAPQREVLGATPLEQREAWAVEQCMSTPAMKQHLRQCAVRAGLNPNQLTWRALGLTAVRIRVENGDSLKALMEHFAISDIHDARRLLRNLERYGEPVHNRSFEHPEAGTLKPSELQSLRSNAQPGLYAKAFSADELRLLKQAQPAGVAGEVAALRLVMLRALERLMQNGSPAELLRLLDSFSAATQRLASTLKTTGEFSAVDDLQNTLAELTGEILSEKGWQP